MTAKRSQKKPESLAVQQNINESGSQTLPVKSLAEAYIPLSSKAVFWQPRYLAASQNLIHLPFLFWLMETARPSSVVQLGLRDGVGFMGLCQGIDKLGLEAVCMGLQSPTNGDEKLPDKLIESHAALYGDFSFFVKEEIGRASRHMRSAQVDMLVIDMQIDEALITNLQAHWEPLLSDRAVIVLHDPERNCVGKDAEKFYDMLVQSHLSISFPQSEASLEAILIGKKQPDRLIQLAQLELGDAGYLSARNVFTRLGQGLENMQLARNNNALLVKVNSALQEMETRIERLQADQKPLQDMVKAAQDAEQAQVQENAKLQAHIFDLGKEIALIRADGSVASQLDALRRELNEKFDQNSTLEESLLKEQQKNKEYCLEIEALSTDKEALKISLTHAQSIQQEYAQKNKVLNEEKLVLEAEFAKQIAEAKSEVEAHELSQRDEIKKLEEALEQEQKKRKEHWNRAEVLSADKTSLEHQLAVQMKDIARLQNDFDEKLRSIQEKRLSLWEAYEALKLEHRTLLRNLTHEASTRAENVAERRA